ncbi:GNAT family N-acetyltransferase [Kitasatospora sp. NPDC093679]|uniref:GNAT family N-acetyltransferase n=1 Tax=Kitasatospora sp. NPDC093679 TaxID=3154983 RepID=UPI003426DC5B
MTLMLAVRTDAAAQSPESESWLYGSQQFAAGSLAKNFGPAGCHGVYACTPDGTIIGRLLWDQEGGEVWWIGVAAKFRRRGIATALWRLAEHKAATARWTAPRHSEVLLPDGEAWIASL